MAVQDAGEAGAQGESPNTPYDDAFRILMARAGKWLVPFLNEIFHLAVPLPPDTVVTSEADELYRRDTGDESHKVIVDSVLVADGKRYHVECQSGDDAQIHLRISEYDFDIALRNAAKGATLVELPLPRSAVLYLRSSNGTPRELTIRFTDEDGGHLDHRVQVMLLSDYLFGEMVKKDLLFLSPFLMFNYESEIARGRTDAAGSSLDELLHYLNKLYRAGELSGEHYTLFTQLLRRVTDALTRKHPKAQKEFDDIMNGMTITDPIEDLLEEGRKEGLEQGREEGVLDFLFTLVERGVFTPDEAAAQAKDACDVDPARFAKLLAEHQVKSTATKE